MGSRLCFRFISNKLALNQWNHNISLLPEGKGERRGGEAATPHSSIPLHAEQKDYLITNNDGLVPDLDHHTRVSPIEQVFCCGQVKDYASVRGW